MRRGAALLSLATLAYVIAAWQVAPGFYEGFPNPVPYNWVSPPPFATNRQPPLAGHADIKVTHGVSDADSASTGDAQLVVDFLPGVFDGTGMTSISVDIKPVAAYPDPDGFRFVTNVYLVTASAPMVRRAGVVMIFSDILPAPSNIYVAPGSGGAWISIGANQQAQPYTINTNTDELGYFAAGYPSSSVSGGGFGSRVIPIVVAILILIVLVAGIPLAMLRRRRGPAPDEAGSESGS